MADEVKTETTPVTKVVEIETKAPEATTINVDLNGKSYNVSLDLGKDLIAFRDELKKLKNDKAKTEVEIKSEKQKSALLEAMKNSDIESVKSQVAQEYLEKINQYESKIFKGEIKSLLATAGVLPSALDDAVNLAMSGGKVTLEGDTIKLGDKVAKDAIDEFIKTRPHLVAVQANAGKKLTTPVAPKVAGDFQKFTSTLFAKK
jgi:hypothetical protein